VAGCQRNGKGYVGEGREGVQQPAQHNTAHLPTFP
jgi:hypothetical protein